MLELKYLILYQQKFKPTDFFAFLSTLPGDKKNELTGEKENMTCAYTFMRKIIFNTYY